MPPILPSPAWRSRALAMGAQTALIAAPLALLTLNLIGLPLGEALPALWDSRFPLGRLPYPQALSNLPNMSLITVVVSVAYLCSPRVRRAMRACATRPASAAGTIAGAGILLLVYTVSRGEANAVFEPVASACWFTALPLVALILYRSAFRCSARMLSGASILAAGIVLLALLHPAIASAVVMLVGFSVLAISCSKRRGNRCEFEDTGVPRIDDAAPWAHPPRLRIDAILIGALTLAFCLCASDGSLTALESWPVWLPLDAGTWLRLSIMFVLVACGLTGSVALGQHRIEARSLLLPAIGGAIGTGAVIATPPVVLPTAFSLTAILPAMLSVAFACPTPRAGLRAASCEEPIALFPALCVLMARAASFNAASIYDEGALANAGVHYLAIVLVLAIGAATLAHPPSDKLVNPPERFSPFFDRYGIAGREQQIIYALYKGSSFSEVAHELGIRRSTASTYAERCYRKLGVTNKRDALDAIRRFDVSSTQRGGAISIWLMRRCAAIATGTARSWIGTSLWMGCLLFSVGSAFSLRLHVLVQASNIAVGSTIPLLMGAALVALILHRTHDGISEPTPSIACLVSLLSLVATAMLAFPPATPRPAWATALFSELAAYAIIPIAAQCMFSINLIASRRLPFSLLAAGVTAGGLLTLSHAFPSTGATLIIGAHALLTLGTACFILGIPAGKHRSNDAHREIYRMRPLQVIGFALLGAALTAALTRLSPTDLIAPIAATLPVVFAALLAASSALALSLARHTAMPSILPVLPPYACVLAGACCAGGLPASVDAAVSPSIATGALMVIGLVFAWSYPKDVRTRYSLFSLPEHLLRRRLARKAHLTDAEQTVAVGLARGLSVSALASQLVVSPHTIRTHRKHIYQKLGVHSYQEFLEAFQTIASRSQHGGEEAATAQNKITGWKSASHPPTR